MILRGCELPTRDVNTTGEQDNHNVVTHTFYLGNYLEPMA